MIIFLVQKHILDNTFFKFEYFWKFLTNLMPDRPHSNIRVTGAGRTHSLIWGTHRRKVKGHSDQGAEADLAISIWEGGGGQSGWRGAGRCGPPRDPNIFLKYFFFKSTYISAPPPGKFLYLLLGAIGAFNN